jgi:hypothetical protein
MKMVFNGSYGRGCFMVEVVFNGLCNRQQGSGGKEREDECNNQIRVEFVGGQAGSVCVEATWFQGIVC